MYFKNRWKLKSNIFNIIQCLAITIQLYLQQCTPLIFIGYQCILCECVVRESYENVSLDFYKIYNNITIITNDIYRL